MMPTFFTCFNLCGGATKNYKIIIIQFNYPFVLVQISTMLNLLDVTSEFHTMTMFVFINVYEYFMQNLCVCVCMRACERERERERV
jgi:hypothetical protein